MTTLDLTPWSSYAISSLSRTFQNCSNLTQITGLNNLNISWSGSDSVSSMQEVFQNCSSLTSLDLSNWAFTYSASTNSTGLFNGCTSLQYLNISSMDFSTTPWQDYDVFLGVPADCEIVVKDQVAKDYILTQRPDFTNVVIAE